MIHTLTGLDWTIEIAFWLGLAFFIFAAVYTKITMELKENGG